MVGDVGVFDVEAAGFGIGEETLNSPSLSIEAQCIFGELYLKVTFGGSFTILFWSARHSWIEKRLTYVFFRHFWHVEFPFHFGLCRLVVRISKLFGCGLGFCVCHFAAFVR